MAFKNLVNAILNVTNKTWGSTVIYTYLAGGPASTIQAVFHNDYTVIDDIISRSPSIKVKLADLTAYPQEGDSLTIDSIGYVVQECHPDSFGSATLLLGKV